MSNPATEPQLERENAENDQREGVVKWFNKDKGYGFINVEDETRDIFVHFSEIHVEGFKTLTEGSKVGFDLVENEKGLVAKQVHILEAPPPISAGFSPPPSKSGNGAFSYASSMPRISNGNGNGADHGEPAIHCQRTNTNISLQRQGSRRRMVIETSGGPGIQLMERIWRNLMQFEGVGADDAASLRCWLHIYKAFTGHAYNTQGHIPAWIGSEQARDELRVEGLVR
jgi:CspA family cold shock protein